MSNAICGNHRNSRYFPGSEMFSTWARNVADSDVDNQVAAAEAAGWYNLRVFGEAF